MPETSGHELLIDWVWPSPVAAPRPPVSWMPAEELAAELLRVQARRAMDAAYEGGVTDCTNLCCLCRSHHRLKTFAHGWRFTMTGDGTLQVTTPSGVTRTTRPHGLGPPPEPPPPPDDDPPPF